MKKTIGAIALVLAVFSMLYMSNTAFADKAAVRIAPSYEVIDVSDATVANFQITDMDGASSFKIVGRNSASLDPFTTVTGLGNVTSTANQTVSASDLFNQYGYVTLEWKAVDNSNSSHESGLASKLIQP
jgi:hypothetical protein